MTRSTTGPPLGGQSDPALFATSTGAFLLAATYALWQAVAGVGLIAMAFRDIDEALVVWAVGGLVVGLPFTGLLSVLAIRMETAIRGVRPPSPFLWVSLAWGLTLVAHWLVMWLWPFALLGAALTGASHMAEMSIYGLWAVFAVGVGAGAVWASARALRRRDFEFAPRPTTLNHMIPTSVLLCLAYLFACAIPALMWVGWLADDGWSNGSGAWALTAWALAGAAAAVAGAGAAKAWLVRAGRPKDRHLEIAGAVLAAHWAPLFMVAMLPMVRNDDMRWAMISTAFVAILAGTALWSVGRRSPELTPQPT